MSKFVYAEGYHFRADAVLIVEDRSGGGTFVTLPDDNLITLEESTPEEVVAMIDNATGERSLTFGEETL